MKINKNNQGQSMKINKNYENLGSLVGAWLQCRSPLADFPIQGSTLGALGLHVGALGPRLGGQGPPKV